MIYFGIAKSFMKNSYELFLQWYVKCFFIELTLNNYVHTYEKKKRVTALAKTEPVTLIMWDIILSRIN